VGSASRSLLCLGRAALCCVSASGTFLCVRKTSYGSEGRSAGGSTSRVFFSADFGVVSSISSCSDALSSSRWSWSDSESMPVGVKLADGLPCPGPLCRSGEHSNQRGSWDCGKYGQFVQLYVLGGLLLVGRMVERKVAAGAGVGDFDKSHNGGVDSKFAGQSALRGARPHVPPRRAVQKTLVARARPFFFILNNANFNTHYKSIFDGETRHLRVVRGLHENGNRHVE
jgi:hypothetical protein